MTGQDTSNADAKHGESKEHENKKRELGYGRNHKISKYPTCPDRVTGKSRVKEREKNHIVTDGRYPDVRLCLWRDGNKRPTSWSSTSVSGETSGEAADVGRGLGKSL